MLIQDVTPVPKQEDNTSELIEELFKRGVSIAQIFGQYYAMEAIADARHDEIFGNDEEGYHGRAPLTVGDAMLAGVVARDIPVTRQPF